MDMHSREQYLARVREEYRKATKRAKTRLLNEARKRTRLKRKVLIRKLAHPPKPNPGKRGPRKATYGAGVSTALLEQIDRLRKANEVRCSDEVAGKLKRISAALSKDSRQDRSRVG